MMPARNLINKRGHHFTACTLLLPIFVLAGCAAVPMCEVEKPVAYQCDSERESPVFKAAAEKFGTRSAYHPFAANPSCFLSAGQGTAEEIGLVLFGIEKPRKELFAHRLDPSLALKKSAGQAAASATPVFQASARWTADGVSRSASQAVEEVLNDPRGMVLTHIGLLTGEPGGVWTKGCLYYSAYPGSGPECVAGGNTIPADLPLYERGWMALERMRSSMADLVSRYQPTHIVVMSSGWNTPEEESIRNYRHWIKRMYEARGKSDKTRFKPLFVGIAWESRWDSLPHFLSVITKGNDADEVGLTWANAVVNGVIGRVADAGGGANRIPVTLIGHSYGVRVLGNTVFLPDVLPAEWRTEGFQPGVFVGLQGAFPIGRYSCEGREPVWAVNPLPRTTTFLTYSKHDSANSLFSFLGYAGGSAAPGRYESLRHVVACQLGSFGTGLLDEAGQYTAEPGKQVYLLNAEAVVNCQWPCTGGGAHSDVYDEEIGRFILQAIQVSERK